jgi:hypothetical protein
MVFQDDMPLPDCQPEYLETGHMKSHVGDYRSYKRAHSRLGFQKRNKDFRFFSSVIFINSIHTGKF